MILQAVKALFAKSPLSGQRGIRPYPLRVPKQSSADCHLSPLRYPGGKRPLLPYTDN